MSSERPTSREVKMEHLGPGASVTVQYREATIGEIADIEDSELGAVNKDISAIAAELLINGKKQSVTSWWRELPASKFKEFVEVLRELKPQREGGEGDNPFPSGNS